MTKGDTGDTANHRRRQNMAASVRSRLTTLAHTRGEEAEYVLTRYALERLLYRLGQSAYADQFILKGALLFALWEGHPHRATRDLDLLGFGPSEVSHLEQIFRDLCTLDVEDDGITFHPETIQARPIRKQQDYGGIRVLLQTHIGTARLNVQADIGFGDVVTPPAQVVAFPTLLDLPAPHLRVYPRETVVAEKFEAMVRLGMGNSRMKDFYDLVTLARQFVFNGPTLADAIRATFTRRGTDLPPRPPLALTDEFADDVGKKTEWQAFLKRIKQERSDLSLHVIIADLRLFLLPILQSLIDRATFDHQWHDGGPWQSFTR